MPVHSSCAAQEHFFPEWCKNGGVNLNLRFTIADLRGSGQFARAAGLPPMPFISGGIPTINQKNYEYTKR
jgi:hypothetical protein